jgi:transcriptional regulator with XRE-family HTH domain
MFGLGKKRSKFGKWLDKKGVSQQSVARKSGVSRSTISNLAKDPDHTANTRTLKKIMKALKEVDPSVKSNNFWDM